MVSDSLQATSEEISLGAIRTNDTKYLKQCTSTTKKKQKTIMIFGFITKKMDTTH